MDVMIAFGWASVMLCLGMFLRAKVSVFRKMLVPASVIGGVIGSIFINIASGLTINIGTGPNVYTMIVNHLFTLSFISISLTSVEENQNSSVKNIIKGALGLGLVWCLLYALTPIIGMGVIALTGTNFKMNSIYGMLIPFAFCQGPGQAVAYGEIFEMFGWENATTVAVAFAAIGFIAAFFIGVPIARFGIKKGLAKNCGKIDDATLKGYLRKEEQTQYMMKDTTCSSNVETLTFHFALIGVCYLLAVFLAFLFGKIPGFFGTSLSNMMFMNGMFAAYIIRWLMKKLNLDFLLENMLQSKITGWTADYLVVCSFMAVSVGILSEWMIPIISVVFVTTIVTFAVCFYFGQRFGGTNDFERSLGLYGVCTGTVPSGIALVRIVDPNFRTTTSIELGACNMVMLASTPVYIIILAYASGTIGIASVVSSLLVCAMIYLVLLKLTKSWGKKTFRWK